MFKVGEEVLIRSKVLEVNPANLTYDCEIGIGGRRYGYEIPAECIVFTDKTYSDGLNDAWELAKKIYDTTHADRNKIFGMDNSCNGIKNVFDMFKPEEALAKIEAYEKEKEIKVGDVVEDEEGTKALVIDEATENTCFVFTENGCVEDWYKMDLKKTGNKISIESLLRQIGE